LDSRHHIIDADDPVGAAWLADMPEAVAVSTNADFAPRQAKWLKAVNVSFNHKGASIQFESSWGNGELQSALIGAFNVSNLLLVMATLLALGYDLAELIRSAHKLTGVCGRMEMLHAPHKPTVIVDYAHTPDGMENVLRTARAVTTGRIITVFGCGGDRDRTKRPIMGRIAAELGDVIVLTSDNPRTEDPAAILDEVEAGVLPAIGGKPYEKLVDRRTAIFHAVQTARAGDTVVILGKGHETYQILKDGTIHFDDRETAAEAIRSRQ